MQKAAPQALAGKKAKIPGADPSVQVANIKAKAAKMRGQGLISQASHDKLMAKADKVDMAAAAAAKGMSRV